MTLAYRATVTCRACGKPAAVSVYQSVTAWVDPQVASEAADNRLNRLDCPSCHQVAFIDSELLYNDAAHGFVVQFASTRTVQLAQLEDELKKAAAAEPKLKARLVINRSAFVEKVRVFRAGLDDIGIEVLKLMLKPQLPAALHDAELRFDKLGQGPQGEKLSFTASLADHPTQVVSVPRASYDSAVSTYVAPHPLMATGEIFVDDRIAGRLLHGRP